jgi:SAM-dependent methyltransferase
MQNNFELYKKPFCQLLNNLPIQQLPYNYASTYMQHIVKNKEYFIDIFAAVLQQVVNHSTKPFAEMQIIDFGCGNGVLSAFAAFCGCKKIIGIDTNEPVLRTANWLNKQLGLHAIFIKGNYNEIINLPIECNAIIGTDVIEHVYSIDALLANICALNKQQVCVFTTASVYENIFKSKKLKNLMYKDEYIDSNAFENSNNAFAGESFFNIRKKIIAATLPTFSTKEIEFLATQTRGLHQQDIEIQLEQYKKTQKINYTPPDSYNTCNPINGSFTERLLPLHAYQKKFTAFGFTMHITNGFYNHRKNKLGKACIQVLNKSLQLLAPLSVKIAPFIIITGVQKQAT